MTKKIKRTFAVFSAMVMCLAMLLYFPSGMFSNIDWGLTAFADDNGYINGFCTEYESNGSCTNESHKNCHGYQPATLTTDNDIDGDGANDSVYEINNAGQLYWFMELCNGVEVLYQQETYDNSGYAIYDAILKDDIIVNENLLDANGDVTDTNGIREWFPIGYNCDRDNDGNNEDIYYVGTFDGQNHTISGLYFNNSKVDAAGLFGQTCADNNYDTCIKNVNVVDSYFNGVSVGGICGFNFNAKIINCYNNSTIIGTTNVGGVCGFMQSSYPIENCSNTGSVTANERGRAGGICAYIISGTISNCNNTGSINGYSAGGVCCTNCGIVKDSFNIASVYGTEYVGGVCGQTSSTNPQIENCYNSGTININGSQNYGGGVCGYNTGIIKKCYNSGNVSASRAMIGGICGSSTSSGTIINCYNAGNIIVEEDYMYVGSLFGYNASSIENCHTVGTATYANDIGKVIGLNDSQSITNCYYLASEETDDIEGTVNKTTDQFASGEVAYLLQSGQTAVNGIIPEVWGQKIGTDNYPVLGGKKVLGNSDQSEFANDIIIYGQSASLNGMIGFNIYVAADENYDWDKTVNGVQGEETENGIYKFTYQVAAKDMAKNITFYINENVNATVSVKGYLDDLKTTSDENTVALIDAMETYGTAADKFFSDDTVEAVEGVTAETLSDYNFTTDTMPEGITYYGSSLLLKSETTVRHYFKLADGQEITNFTFTVDGVTAEPTEKQGYYYIDIENISADKLGTGFTVSINGEDVITNYSALSYAKTVLEKSDDENLKNLVKTLYLYNRAAVGYNVKTGWVQDGENWYYYDDNGIMQTGWVTGIPGYDDAWFYFNNDGIMQTGWVTNIPGYDDARFYFNNNGIMQTGWVQDGENWYYLNDDGTLLRNGYTPDGYYVDENGIWTGM